MNDPHENATWVYNYDRGGNITSKVKYAFTTGTLGSALQTIPYVYGDTNWKDKLTSYNGQTITYDAIGNPLNDGNWTYEWQAGRQLKQMSTEGASVSFKYDHNGMRVQKVVEQSWYPETTNYIYHGKLLTHMTVDYTDFDEVAHQDKMHFFYDAQSRPAKVSYNGVIYTSILHLQGDIVAIVDSGGNPVVEYKYDAWDRSLSTAGSMADTLGKKNPFRYRGYVYDDDTELYYLRSRYCRPVWGRFINADTVIGAAGELFSHTLYAYCSNSPVGSNDPSGHMSMALVGVLQSPPVSNYVSKLLGGIELFLKAAVTAAVGLLVKTIANTKVEPRTESQLQTALLSASASYAGSRDLSYSTDSYDFAFMLSDPYTKYGYLVYINAPLTKQEAQTALLSQSIVQSLTNAHGFKSNAYGIYSDLQWPAYDLSVSTNGSIEPENHIDTSKNPGDYYWHYHAFANSGVHGPHIWFGPGSYKY